HCDYYLNNVLVNKNLEISAVLDFSVHASVGDKRIDVASLAYLNLDKNIRPEYIEYLLNIAKSKYGDDVEKFIKIYGIYYGFYYADTHEFNMDSYKWCIGYINNDKNWIF
ncbi:MAG: phosphotransferase, partial [Bacteroidota bacterium]